MHQKRMHLHDHVKHLANCGRNKIFQRRSLRLRADTSDDLSPSHIGCLASISKLLLHSGVAEASEQNSRLHNTATVQRAVSTSAFVAQPAPYSHLRTHAMASLIPNALRMWYPRRGPTSVIDV